MPMYLRYLTLIQKRISANILNLADGTTFLVLMFQLFTAKALLRIKNFEPLCLCKKK